MTEVYPAAVTPFDERGKVDLASLARLLAYFEAAGCAGAVLAGTNGEGPSLSPVERRDLLREAMPLRGRLKLILGIATASMDEAVWQCKQAGAAGGEAVLLMAPSYFREATEEAIGQWFRAVLDASPIPVLLYNFPKRTGFIIRPELLASLADHPRLVGVKDSSGEAPNLTAYRQALPNRLLYVGDETLLLPALEAGWSGTISGAANVLPRWLVQISGEWPSESAQTKFELVLPLIQRLRQGPQPALNKALLRRAGIIEREDVRLPLLPADPPLSDEVQRLIEAAVGALG
jgi:4-hydroxy-tetrahydrodipicolinate synthase